MNAHNPLPEGNLAENVANLMLDILNEREYIEDALSRLDGMFTFNDVVASVLRQQRHFYKFPGCFVIMEVSHAPGYDSFHCFIAGGDMQAIKDAEPTLMEIGKSLGCKKLSINGRVGWSRELKQNGWEHKLSVLYKDII